MRFERRASTLPPLPCHLSLASGLSRIRILRLAQRGKGWKLQAEPGYYPVGPIPGADSLHPLLFFFQERLPENFFGLHNGRGDRDQ